MNPSLYVVLQFTNTAGLSIVTSIILKMNNAHLSRIEKCKSKKWYLLFRLFDIQPLTETETKFTDSAEAILRLCAFCAQQISRWNPTNRRRAQNLASQSEAGISKRSLSFLVVFSKISLVIQK